MLRGKLPVTEGMYIEMRAKLPTGIGAWPAFWLNPGVQYPDGKFSELPWPPEIDIFEFFNWQGRPKTRVMTGYVQMPAKHKERYGQRRRTCGPSSRTTNTSPALTSPRTFTCSRSTGSRTNPSGCWMASRSNRPTTSGPHRCRRTSWSPTQLGMVLKGVDVSEMKADESQWDYVIDYIRVWRRKP